MNRIGKNFFGAAAAVVLLLSAAQESRADKLRLGGSVERLTLACLADPFAPCEPNPPPPGPIEGRRVEVRRNGKLIAAANTNRLGRYVFTLPPGIYRVSTSGRGKTATLKSRDRLHLNFKVFP